MEEGKRMEDGRLDLGMLNKFISDTCSPLLFSGTRTSHRDKLSASLTTAESKLAVSKFAQDNESVLLVELSASLKGSSNRTDSIRHLHTPLANSAPIPYPIPIF
jgi:hypothetical protein